MKNAIVLCSGGLDSVVASHYIFKKGKYGKIIILFFNYKQRTLKQERIASKKCAKDLNADFFEINLNWLGGLSSSLINTKKKAKKIRRKQLGDTAKEAENYYVPFRNSVFLISAMALAEAKCIKNKEKYDIIVGFKCEGREPYPDTTKNFVKKINSLGKSSLEEIKVFAPLIEFDKDKIVLLGKHLNVNMKNTYSCYVGTGKKHCGSCLSCRLRQEAFYWANVKDPTKYKIKMKDFRIA